MKIYRTILSLGFAMLVLLSSSSFMVGLHFCGDKLGIALFSKAECGMEMKMPPCHQATRSCCDDEVIIHQGQDFKNTINEFQFQPEVIAELVSPITISEIISEQAGRIAFTHYQPPLRTPDLILSLETFRI